MISVRLPSHDDLERLLTWRNRDAVRAVSLNEAPIELAQHEKWFAQLLAVRQGHFGVVCFKERPVGVIQLEAFTESGTEASWGCHLGEVDVPPGFGATLPVLGLALGFRGWDLDRMTAEVLETNRNMLGIHRRLSIRTPEVDQRQIDRLEGAPVGVVGYEVGVNEFDSILAKAERLLPRAISKSLSLAVGELGSWRSLGTD